MVIFTYTLLHFFKKKLRFLLYCRLIGDIGLKHLDVVPEVVPLLISALEDSTPAVARQALNCGLRLFRCILEKVVIQVGVLNSMPYLFCCVHVGFYFKRMNL